MTMLFKRFPPPPLIRWGENRTARQVHTGLAILYVHVPVKKSVGVEDVLREPTRVIVAILHVLSGNVVSHTAILELPIIESEDIIALGTMSKDYLVRPPIVVDFFTPTVLLTVAVKFADSD